MFKKKKIKMVKMLIVLLLIIVTSLFVYKLLEKNNFENIDIKYVEKINSNLYQTIKVYKYNDDLNQYEIIEKIVEKENVIMEIFNYYNNDLKYKVKNIETDDFNLLISVECNEEDFSFIDFKLMKLSYQTINIQEVVIQYQNVEYII